MNEPTPSSRQAYLERQPIVDRQGDTFGYELSYRSSDGAEPDDFGLAAASAVLAHVLDSLDMGWLPSGKRVFINADIEVLTDADFLALLPEGRVVLNLHGDPARVDEETLRGCDALKLREIGICLDGSALLAGSPELLIRANFVKLDLAGSDSYSLYDEIQHLASYPARKIAKQVSNGKEYSFCHGMGIDLFQGYFFTRPEIIVEKEMNTSIAQLVQLFELVGASAEPRELEVVFKRDPALMVKLLGYINSAGMGVGRKVTSIHQAIVLLGYRQLYRWVALLLYTAGNTAAPAALMKTVLTRSRFIELLGQTILPKHAQENLFMIGMLSLLDVVFGQSLPKALARLPLPDQIVRAILDHEGIHGRLLMLAEAAEQSEWETVRSLAEELQLTAGDINRMQIEAMIWAESLALH